MSSSNCAICNASSAEIFTKEIMGKYTIAYYKCSKCGFVQTEKPYWLKEAYSSAIANADIGILDRNIKAAEIVSNIILNFFDKNARFLDYAGGYGIFTRIMRDKGFDFYHEDPYCENVYARFFSSDDLKQKSKFEMITAFEVMEHLEDPLKIVEEMLTKTDNFFFSTELQPKTGLEDWWYILPLTGQHISFYTHEALEILAKKNNAYLYTDGQRRHLITRQHFDIDPFVLPQRSIMQKVMRKFKRLQGKQVDPALPASLLQNDFEMTLERLKG